MLSHPIAPVWDEYSRILVLGTFPSEASRKAGFYYGHPRNRFWNVLALVYGETVPGDVQQKKSFLITHRIALWDVLKECEITGSSDSTIKNPVSNDVGTLLEQTNIQCILLNGSKACALYKRFRLNEVKVPFMCLPSTSPANAAWTLERLVDEWSQALKA